MSKELRLLIVEDSEEDTELLLFEIRRRGYFPKYRRCETEGEMRNALEESPWDVILADFRLPLFSAPAALEVLHQTEYDIPFISMSGVIRPEDAVKIMRAGAHDFIEKGDLSRLIPAIEREIREAELRAETRAYRLAQTKNEERLKLALESNNDGLWDWNIEQGTIFLSPRLDGMLGQKSSGERPTKHFWKNMVHEEDFDFFQRNLSKHLQNETPYFEVEFRAKTLMKHVIWFLARGKVVARDENNAPLRMLGTLSDISARKAADAQLRIADTVFKVASDGFLVLDPQGNIQASNPYFCSLFGLRVETLSGMNIADLSFLQGVASIPDMIAMTLENTRPRQDEIDTQRYDGKTLHLALTITIVRDEQANHQQTVIAFHDVTKRREAERLMVHQANYDTLTDLPNRYLFMDRAHAALLRARRDNMCVAVAFIDLDHFKWVNDTMGHAAGDQLLRQCAKRISEVIRGTDTAARLGGDEFTLVLSNISEGKDAEPVIKKLIESLATPFNLDLGEARISASIGLSIYPQDAENVANLLKNADIAMYHAKEAGRNRFRFFTPDMNIQASERIKVEHSIRSGLSNGDFVLHYQPVINIQTGTLSSVEALLRWNHPEKGLISAGEFLNVAEDTGQILALGEWTIETVITQLKEWQKADTQLTRAKIAINLSSRQWRQGHALQTLQDHLVNVPELAPFLMLEVSEKTLSETDEEILRALAEVRKIGVQLLVDDFGSGYTSLRDIRRLNTDALKLDHDFLNEALSPDGDRTIVEATIAMCKSLDIEVIAKGIETIEQLSTLKSLNCDCFQGFLMAPPMAAQDLNTYLFCDPSWHRLLGRS